MRYFGSVAFFRHLIILALLLMAVLSGKYLIDVFIRKEPSEIKKERVSDLQYDKKSLSESDGTPQNRHPSFSYQSAYSELYGAAGQERELQDGVVYLTFDDGPSKYTPAFLDLLKKHGVQATFFLVGTNVQRYPSVVRRIKSEGHAIGVHTYSHKYLQIYMNVDSYLKDFSMAKDAIYRATGDRCAIFRFPGGSINVFNSRIYGELTAEMLRRGFKFYDWNVSAGDAVKKTIKKNIIDNVANNVRRDQPNIVLMHDTSELSLTSLEQIILRLKKENYIFKALGNEDRPITFTHIK